MGDVTSREVVSLELVGREGESGFYRGNAAVNDQRRGNLTEAHEDEVEQADGSAGCARLKPDTEEFDQDSEENKESNDCCCAKDDGKGAFFKKG